MKTRNIFAAMIIAAFTFSAVGAYAQESPAIKIYQSGKALKVVFGYQSNSPVIVDFLDQNGTFGTDKVDQSGLDKGFIRHYNVLRDTRDTYWVNVKNDVISARFQITTNAKGKLESTLETVTYNQPIAKR